jgi:hypothetical protein
MMPSSPTLFSGESNEPDEPVELIEAVISVLELVPAVMRLWRDLETSGLASIFLSDRNMVLVCFVLGDASSDNRMGKYFVAPYAYC